MPAVLQNGLESNPTVGSAVNWAALRVMAAPEEKALQEVEAVPEVGGTAPEAKVIPEACAIPQARAVVLKRIQIGADDSQVRLLTLKFILIEQAEVTSQL
jgi:hypothetical protein